MRRLLPLILAAIAAFIVAPQATVTATSVTSVSVYDIARLLSDAGPGARGIVYGSRADTYGHVFNGVNQGGVICFLDGQSGVVANWEDGFDAFYFLRTN